MLTFWDWLLLETRSLVDPAVVASYERAFHEGLEALIGRTTNPHLRQTFATMRQFRFTDYILGALLKNGLHQQYDAEDSRSETGRRSARVDRTSTSMNSSVLRLGSSW
jgi:hypothetical protein